MLFYIYLHIIEILQILYLQPDKGFRKTFQSVYTGYKNIFFLYFGLFPYGFELNNDSLLILNDFYGHSFIIDSLFRLISFVTFTSYNYSVLCV